MPQVTVENPGKFLFPSEIRARLSALPEGLPWSALQELPIVHELVSPAAKCLFQVLREEGRLGQGLGLNDALFVTQHLCVISERVSLLSFSEVHNIASVLKVAGSREQLIAFGLAIQTNGDQEQKRELRTVLDSKELMDLLRQGRCESKPSAPILVPSKDPERFLVLEDTQIHESYRVAVARPILDRISIVTSDGSGSYSVSNDFERICEVFNTLSVFSALRTSISGALVKQVGRFFNEIDFEYRWKDLAFDHQVALLEIGREAFFKIESLDPVLLVKKVDRTKVFQNEWLTFHSHRVTADPQCALYHALSNIEIINKTGEKGNLVPIIQPNGEVILFFQTGNSCEDRGKYEWQDVSFGSMLGIPALRSDPRTVGYIRCSQVNEGIHITHADIREHERSKGWYSAFLTGLRESFLCIVGEPIFLQSFPVVEEVTSNALDKSGVYLDTDLCATPLGSARIRAGWFLTHLGAYTISACSMPPSQLINKKYFQDFEQLLYLELKAYKRRGEFEKMGKLQDALWDAFCMINKPLSELQGTSSQLDTPSYIGQVFSAGPVSGFSDKGLDDLFGFSRKPTRKKTYGELVKSSS